MVIVSAAQMRELDRGTIAAGVPEMELMERAAAAVVAYLAERHARALLGPVAVLCGPGNNGGDARLVASLLRTRGATVHEFELAEGAGGWVRARPAILACGLLVDGLFGIGLSRPLAGAPADIVTDLNQNFHGAVIAVDIPSGLGADGEGATEAADAPVLRASATVSFTRPKLGQLLSRHAAATGALRIVSIGTPDTAVAALPGAFCLTTPRACAPFLARRERDAHKGSYGHVFVFGGAVGKAGAAVLAATAALRAGAGLVTAVVPSAILPTVAAARAEIMTAPRPAAQPALHTLLRAASVVAVGPGLGRDPGVASTVRGLLPQWQSPLVVDADGLNAFAGLRAQLRFTGRAVLTPHPGEMARLFDVDAAAVQARRLYYVQRLAAESGAVVVLKGHRSLIADAAGMTWVNASGNPGMATGGSGDVLTGMIAGLMAQFPALPLLATVAAAVYLHGRAGDAAAARHGEASLLAGDIVDAIGDTMLGVRAEAHPESELPYDIPA